MVFKNTEKAVQLETSITYMQARVHLIFEFLAEDHTRKYKSKMPSMKASSTESIVKVQHCPSRALVSAIWALCDVMRFNAELLNLWYFQVLHTC